MLATLPYSYEEYNLNPFRNPPRQIIKYWPPQDQSQGFYVASSSMSRSNSSRRTSRSTSSIDEAFWGLEEEQKQDRLINVILALLHI